MDELTDVVRNFARATCAWPERVLDSNGWAWDEYEGVRYAHLHAAMALRALAGRLHRERWSAGRPFTLALHALADHQAAFRDFEALLLGVHDSLLDVVPAPQEWPVRTIVAHVREVEHYFLGTILNALMGGEARELETHELAALTGLPAEPPAGAGLAELWASFEQVHHAVQQALAGLDDAAVQQPSAMWESTHYPILFRMQRFAAHLREHTNQLAKTLRWLDAEPGEAKLLARQLYAALAEVEGLRIGQGDLGAQACGALAAEWQARFENLYAAREQIDRFHVAVEAGDAAQVAALLDLNPGLGYARMDDGTTAVLYSHYRRRDDLVRAFLESGLRLSVFEAAALGDVARLTRLLGWDPALLHAWSKDGYTPLQLSCFFGQAECARLLVERGADVHAVSRNEMQIQPIHAAVAGRHVEIVRLLIGAGADVSAAQAGGMTPLQAAEQSGDATIAALLRSAGAQGSPQ